MQIKTFKYGRLSKEAIERLDKDVNAFLATVEVVQVIATQDGDSSAITQVLYKPKEKSTKKSE